MRKFQHLLGIVVLLGVVVTGILPAAAQANSPLVFVMNGDLWKWSAGQAQPTQMTTWGYNFRPMMSPDGNRVAYKSWAQLSVNFLDNGGAWAGDMPANIWVMDVETTDAVRVADQPANASIDNTNGPVNSIFRSDPVWSPQGDALAWVEYVNNAFQLVVYNFSINTSRVIAELPYPFMDGGIFVPAPKWGYGGISYLYFGMDDDGQNFIQELYVYAPDGTLISRTVVSPSPENYLLEDFWFGNNVGFLSNSGSVTVLNLDAKTYGSANGVPSMQAGGGASATFLQLVPGPSDGTANIKWYVMDNTLNTLAELPYSGTWNNGGVAPAPDGFSYAFIADALYVWTDGKITKVPNTDGILESNFGWGAGVAWAYPEWGIQSGGNAQPPVMGACPNNALTRLIIGQQATVIPGLGVNVLRAEPRKGSDNATLGNVPENGVVTVLQGPVCSNNINWWQVEYNGLIGWTGESENQTYWLAPR